MAPLVPQAAPQESPSADTKPSETGLILNVLELATQAIRAATQNPQKAGEVVIYLKQTLQQLLDLS